MRRYIIYLCRDDVMTQAPDMVEETSVERKNRTTTGVSAKPKAKMVKNNVRTIRESHLMSKAELARKAGLSVLTVGRIESGVDCRMDTKRKVILALGLTLAEKDKVFPEG